MLENSANSVLASEVAEFLGRELHGENVVVYGPTTLDNVKDRSMIYLRKDDKLPTERIAAELEILIISENELGDDAPGSYIVTSNPELDFVHVVNKFFKRITSPEIHKSAVIEDGANVGLGVSVGSGSYIGPEVEVGEYTSICQNVVIIGKVKIGQHCVIKPNSSIGSEIFNFVYGEETWEQFPQVGKIVIGDNVWVGANTTIEKGTLTDTVIHAGVKIDDLVQIGSSCVIEDDSIIAAGTVLCHDVKIGKKCWVAPNVSILQKVQIGGECTIGLGSVVLVDVLNRTIVAGNPAQPISSGTKPNQREED